MKELVEDEEQRLVKSKGAAPRRRFRFLQATAYHQGTTVCVSTVENLEREGWIEPDRDPLPNLRSFKATWKAHSELN